MILNLFLLGSLLLLNSSVNSMEERRVIQQIPPAAFEDVSKALENKFVRLEQ